MAITKVTRNYQITIPREVREVNKIKVGDKIILIEEPDGIKMKKMSDDVFKKAFGMWKNMKIDSVEYVRKLRKEDERRMKRLGL